MSNDEFELVRGSRNVFRDLDEPDADINQPKASLAAKIIGALDEQGLSVRKAHQSRRYYFGRSGLTRSP